MKKIVTTVVLILLVLGAFSQVTLRDTTFAPNPTAQKLIAGIETLERRINEQIAIEIVTNGSLENESQIRGFLSMADAQKKAILAASMQIRTWQPTQEEILAIIEEHNSLSASIAVAQADVDEPEQYVWFQEKMERFAKLNAWVKIIQGN